jgi:chromosomal replication initiator protein
VVLGAPSAFAREWAEKKYAATLSESLETQLGRPGVQVRFVVSKTDLQPLLGTKPLPLQEAASRADSVPAPHADFSEVRDGIRPGHLPQREEAPAPRPAPAVVRSAGARNPFSDELAGVVLNERFTFDTFVVGKSNRLAHAGAIAVSESPGASYNPLFVYGSPGLGKTHLVQAIGHAIRQRLPQANVAYVSGETFANHFIAALRERRQEDFRRAYRNIDVWLVDDVQTIASKEVTKEEFFHTFNTLQQLNKQIVIASDRSPRELRTMDERLRSRFESGLIADIAPPELEIRIAILQKKAAVENIAIPDEVIAFMANLIQSNIRALEGALIKLMAYASLANAPITKQLASDVLSSYFVERMTLPGAGFTATAGAAEVSPAGADVDTILDAIGSQFGIEAAMIRQPGNRRKDVALARQIAMYLCKDLTRVPLTVLAETFGCKNHSAIFHAHKRLAADLDTDPQLLGIVCRIRQALEAVR